MALKKFDSALERTSTPGTATLTLSGGVVLKTTTIHTNSIIYSLNTFQLFFKYNKKLLFFLIRCSIITHDSRKNKLTTTMIFDIGREGINGRARKVT